MKLIIDNIDDAVFRRVIEVAAGQHRTVSSLVEEVLINGGLGLEGIPINEIFGQENKGQRNERKTFERQ